MGIYFTLFNQKVSHLYDLIRNGITVGPSLIFHCHHEVDVTDIRKSELGDKSLPSHAIVGYDGNSPYLWSISPVVISVAPQKQNLNQKQLLPIP